MPAETIIDKVKETASTLSDKVEELKDDLWSEEQKLIMEEFKESSIDRVKEILTNITNSSALFDKSGFHQTGLNVSQGLPPVIASEFKATKTITDEEREKLLKEVKDNKIVNLL